jgi:hypothetical protein
VALPVAIAEGSGRGSVSVHFGDSISDPVVRIPVRSVDTDRDVEITKKY